jgi:hypothetical protein
MKNKILPGLLIAFGVFVLTTLTVVGPWPAYSSTDVEHKPYYVEALQRIDDTVKGQANGSAPGPLMAGWGRAVITPTLGTPLAGFGDRKGRPSTGVHDELFVKALVLSDGDSYAAIIGADMLIVPENVADIARARIVAETELKDGDILFNASHTHSGPGAFGPGPVSKAFSGAYDETVVDFLGKAFADAVVQAFNALEPASVASGSLAVPQYIRNRARNAAVDPFLDYLRVRQEDGDDGYVVRYSAHPTVLGGRNMAFSADFPGYLQRRIEDEVGGFAMYLGGAVGSMGARVPDGADGFEQAQALGYALADKVLEAASDAEFSSSVAVRAVAVPITPPPFQLRLTKGWRVSPLLLPLAGVDHDAWVGAVRVGTVILVGAPGDFSGEISVELRAWGREQGVDLWPLSFNADYVGYISPDAYYADGPWENDGHFAYETGLMSWCGPNQEAYFTGLMKQMVASLYPLGNW